MNRRWRVGSAAATLCLFLATGMIARGDDWPKWQGPTRDDVWRETGNVQKFSAGGPKILWRLPIAGGYSGPAVAGGKVFVTDYVRASGEAKNDFATRSGITG